jgi:hypothetical protein
MLILILSLALSAAPADSVAATPTTPVAAKPEKPKKICRADGTTGSRLKSRICKTQEEWDAMNRSMKDDVRAKTGGNAG